MQRSVAWLIALFSVFPVSVPAARSAQERPAHPGGMPAASSRITAYAISPDGKLLAVGNDDHNVRLWRTSTGRLIHTLHGHTAPISCLAFSPDSATLAAGAPDHTVRLWRVDSGMSKGVLRGPGETTSALLFSPDGSILAADSSGAPAASEPAEISRVLVLWNASTVVERAVLKPPHGAATPVLFSPDGGMLVTAGGYWDPVEVWDVRTRKYKFEAGSDYLTTISAVAFSSDGKAMAVGGWRNQGGEGEPEIVNFISIVRTSDGQTTPLPGTPKLDFSGSDRSGEELPGRGEMALSRNGSLIAVATAGNRLELFMRDGKPLATLNDASPPLAFSADSTRLMAVRHDSQVAVWNIRYGRVAPSTIHVPLSIFPADLTHRLSADGNKITLRSLITGRVTRVFKQP